MGLSFQRSLRVCSLLVGLIHVANGDAFAQTPYKLVPLLTDQLPIAGLSDKFGVPIAGAVNDAGDYAFVGVRGSGLYYRKAGNPHAIRVIQQGDEVPGVPGSRLNQIFTPLLMNSSGLIAVRVELFATSDQLTTHAYLKFNGTTLETVIRGTDTAPGGGTYSTTSALLDMNDQGALLISRTNAPARLVYAPAGGAAVLMASVGDAAPGMGAGTFTAITGHQVSNSSEALFSSSIAGGTGTSGLYVWKNGVLRKIVGNNDANPLGGTFTDAFNGTVRWRLNHSGVVAFAAASAVFLNTELGGTSAIANVGTATSDTGTLSAGSWSVIDMNETGDVLFGANSTTNSGSFGFFLYRNGSVVDVVMKAAAVAPGTGGKIFAAISIASMNQFGTVSFNGFESPSQPWLGVFQKTVGGALTNLALQGDAVLGGQLFDRTSTAQATLNSSAFMKTLASGAVFFRAHVFNAPEATHGHFLASAGSPVVALMSTADALPAGARTSIRPQFLTAAGDYVGFAAARAGGRDSVGVVSASSQAVTIAATDGDVVAGTGGSRLNLGPINTVMPNAAGDVVLHAALWGGPGLVVRNAILIGGTSAALGPVVIDGMVDNGGRVLTVVSLQNSIGSVRPTMVNSTGLVSFMALVNGGNRGVFVGQHSGVPQKVALQGENLGGTLLTIQSIPTTATQTSINDLGQVLFPANTSLGQGLFLGLAGQQASIVSVPGQPAPGGGTWLSLGVPGVANPALNNAGQVAYMATTTGGPGGGIYLGSLGNVVAIALHGAASPAGGTFVLNFPGSDVVINDAGDVAFKAFLAGGASDSAIFLKRAGQPIEVVASQGQPSPGVAGVFATLTSPNNLAGQPHQLSANGHVAFYGTVGSFSGWWHREPGGAMQLIAYNSSSPAEFDGGSARNVPRISSWIAGNRIPMWIPLVGAPHTGGLYMWKPQGGAATGTGSNVAVQVQDPFGATATVTFGNVSVAGTTTLSQSTTGPALPRGWYRTWGLPVFFNVNTTATVSGNITVCVQADVNTFPLGSIGTVLRMLHYTNGAWQDVTTVAGGGGSGTDYCGVVTSLSPFVVAHALNEPATNIIQNGNFSSGTASWNLFEPPDIVHNSAANGVFQYYRASPTTTPSGQSVILQNTGVGFVAGDAIVAHFDLGNSDNVRKRISILIHATNFSDLHVCTFWLPANAPMRSYAMRTHPTIDWPGGASISIYAASSGTSNGGTYQLDNVVMGRGNPLGVFRTDCVDPLEPGVTSTADGPALLANGDFSNGLASWTPFGTITAQVTNGVAQFIRPSSAAPSGALVQPTGIAVPAGRVVTAVFQLGNSSNARKRISVLLHDQFFADLSACTFWLPAGQPLTTYIMRTYATSNWSSAMISFYPATTDQAQWFELDNVTMGLTPAAATYGADCVEPGDFVGGYSSAPAPVGPGSEPEVALVWARSREGARQRAQLK